MFKKEIRGAWRINAKILLIGMLIIVSVLTIYIIQGIEKEKDRIFTLQQEEKRDLMSKCYATDSPSPFFNREGNLKPSGWAANEVSVMYGANPEQEIRIGFIDGEEVSIAPSGRQYFSTYSMSPIIGNRTMIITVSPKESEIQHGDMIIFNCSNFSLLHRVIGMNGSRYITKGDNNDINDIEAFGCSPEFKDIHRKIVGVLY